MSWLIYADRLMEFPTALLGVALGVGADAAACRRRRASDDAAGYSGMLDWGLRLALLLALPCAVALLVFPEPLVAALFQRGQFDALASPRPRCALRGYGVGLIGLVGVKILAPGFYARQDIRTPVTIAVIVLVLTQAMNLRLRAAASAMPAWRSSIGLGALINAVWLLRRPAPRRLVPARRRAGAGSPLQVRVRHARCSARCSPGGRDGIDWIGLQPAARRCAIGWLAACLGAAPRCCTSARCSAPRAAAARNFAPRAEAARRAWQALRPRL